MPRIPPNVIDQIRDVSDIIDVISREVELKKTQAQIILVYAHFMMKKQRHLSVSLLPNKFITALGVEVEEMFFLF